jgi:RNA polymerase sigma factor (sigma-70 family)
LEKINGKKQMDDLQFDTNLSAKAVYDYGLIRAALEKDDQKAYAELMDRYRDSVYFMLLKMVNNRDDADDLTIEAFGKAFKRLNQYTPTFAFSTWLFKIASNNCIDFIRRKKMVMFSIDKKFENDEGAELSIDVRSDTLTPEESMVKKQKVKHMRDVVEKLKPRYRVLVELRYFDELSYEEIAVKLDLPLGTVKAQLFRAREFLANILKNSSEKI